MNVPKIVPFLKRSSPTILSVLGSVGVIATAIVASKNTIKAVDMMNQKYGVEEQQRLKKAEVVNVCWKCYIPTAAIGSATILCIIGATVINERSQAALVSAYAMVNEAYQKYRKAATIIYGKDADEKIKAQVAKDVYVSNDGLSLYAPNYKDGESMLFYDDFSERYFNATMAAVINAEYHINRNLQLRGYAYLNEFYEFLGIEDTKQGQMIGWSMHSIYDNGFSWLDFDNRLVTLEDGMECYTVYSVLEPCFFDEEEY